MTLEELRVMFWREIATPEMRAEYRAYKTQKTDTVYGAYSEWKDVPHSGS